MDRNRLEKINDMLLMARMELYSEQYACESDDWEYSDMLDDIIDKLCDASDAISDAIKIAEKGEAR